MALSEYTKLLTELECISKRLADIAGGGDDLNAKKLRDASKSVWEVRNAWKVEETGAP